MASDSPKCKSKGCTQPQLSKWPLGSMKYCRTHFNALFPVVKKGEEEESKCQWTLGCGQETLTIGKVHISHCALHVSYSLLFYGVKNAKTPTILKSLNPTREVNGTCTYMYREGGRGYKTGSRCTLKATDLYCPYHSHEAAAVDDCVALSTAILDPLFAATQPKAPSSTVHTGSSREEYCRLLFEKHTGYKFPSVRPDWLKQKRTGQNLELDGYCCELKLAFEYDGEQHYKFPNVFHKSRQDFNEQQDRDALKEALCIREGVSLLRIREDVRKDEIEPMIVKWLKEKGALKV